MSDSGTPPSPGDEPPDELPEGAPDGDDEDIGRDHPEDGGGGGRGRVRKAPNAFRTISEVADDLHIPQHVLRFWETKFPRVKPMKRGGGRRYYRPDDIALLRQISDLLYTQGYTIKGVQRLLREGGGRLAEDIPPPSEEERASPAAEGTTAPMPAPAGEREPPDGRETMGRRPEAAPPVPVPPPAFRATPRRRPDPEAERLRAVLVETLATLRALRSLLP